MLAKDVDFKKIGEFLITSFPACDWKIEEISVKLNDFKRSFICRFGKHSIRVYIDVEDARDDEFAYLSVEFMGTGPIVSMEIETKWTEDDIILSINSILDEQIDIAERNFKDLKAIKCLLEVKDETK